MDSEIKYLAKCRQIEAKYKAQVAEAEGELKESGLWAWLEQRRSFLATARADVKDAEADTRKAALEAHAETGSVQPHLAVRIKLYTEPEFGRFVKQPRATIARDLSEWLESE